MRAALLTAALLAFAAAAWIPGGRRAEPGQVALAIARPFALPGLWARLGDVLVRDDPGEAVAALRLVAELLPEWTDGTIDVAWRHGVELGSESGSPVVAARRLREAEGWLVAAATARGPARPRAAAELLLAAATMLTVCGDRDVELAREYVAAGGTEPIDRAGELTERALAFAGDPSLELRAAHAALRVVAAALRGGDLRRAQLVLDATRERFRDLRANDTAQRALAALDRLPELATLLADPARTRTFRGDPDLDEIAQAIDALTKE